VTIAGAVAKAFVRSKTVREAVEEKSNQLLNPSSSASILDVLIAFLSNTSTIQQMCCLLLVTTVHPVNISRKATLSPTDSHHHLKMSQQKSP